MTSKAQERKALEEIKAILVQLEPEGYVRTALEGCLEIAKFNIDNDFACSMKKRMESAEEKCRKIAADNKMLRARIKDLKDEVMRLKS